MRSPRSCRCSSNIWSYIVIKSFHMYAIYLQPCSLRVGHHSQCSAADYSSVSFFVPFLFCSFCHMLVRPNELRLGNCTWGQLFGLYDVCLVLQVVQQRHSVVQPSKLYSRGSLLYSYAKCTAKALHCTAMQLVQHRQSTVQACKSWVVGASGPGSSKRRGTFCGNAALYHCPDHSNHPCNPPEGTPIIIALPIPSTPATLLKVRPPSLPLPAFPQHISRWMRHIYSGTQKQKVIVDGMK